MFRGGVLGRESKAFIQYQVYMSLIFRSHLVLACWAYPDTLVLTNLWETLLYPVIHSSYHAGVRDTKMNRHNSAFRKLVV